MYFKFFDFLFQIVEAEFADADEDMVTLSVTIARYGRTRKPKPKVQPVVKAVRAVSKPAPVKRVEPPVVTPPPSKPPSRRPSKQPVEAPPPPPPEPVPERDPDPYFVTEDYPVSPDY